MHGIIDEVLSITGLTPGIARAVADAGLAPTSANIAAVVKAYATNGQTPPAKLIAWLIQRNYSEYPNDRYSTQVLTDAVPWILAGLAVWFFFRSKR